MIRRPKSVRVSQSLKFECDPPLLGTDSGFCRLFEFIVCSIPRAQRRTHEMYKESSQRLQLQLHLYCADCGSEAAGTVALLMEVACCEESKEEFQKPIPYGNAFRSFVQGTGRRAPRPTMHPSQLEEDVRPDKMEVEASAAFLREGCKIDPRRSHQHPGTLRQQPLQQHSAGSRSLIPLRPAFTCAV